MTTMLLLLLIACQDHLDQYALVVRWENLASLDDKNITIITEATGTEYQRDCPGASGEQRLKIIPDYGRLILTGTTSTGFKSAAEFYFFFPGNRDEVIELNSPESFGWLTLANYPVDLQAEDLELEITPDLFSRLNLDPWIISSSISPSKRFGPLPTGLCKLRLRSHQVEHELITMVHAGQNVLDAWTRKTGIAFVHISNDLLEGPLAEINALEPTALPPQLLEIKRGDQFTDLSWRLELQMPYLLSILSDSQPKNVRKFITLAGEESMVSITRSDLGVLEPTLSSLIDIGSAGSYSVSLFQDGYARYPLFTKAGQATECLDALKQIVNIGLVAPQTYEVLLMLNNQLFIGKAALWPDQAVEAPLCLQKSYASVSFTLRQIDYYRPINVSIFGPADRQYYSSEHGFFVRKSFNVDKSGFMEFSYGELVLPIGTYHCEIQEPSVRLLRFDFEVTQDQDLQFDLRQK